MPIYNESFKKKQKGKRFILPLVKDNNEVVVLV